MIEGLWNLKCPIGLSQKRTMFALKEVWLNLDGPSKNKEFVELRSDF